MPALILTGDDFGANHAVNEAVEAQYLAGRLSQASLMIHGAEVDEARRIAARNPGLCVGLHLTLCAGKRPGRTRLTDAEGNFEPSPGRAGWRYFWKRSLRRALVEEIEEQFALFSERGFPAIYWDGHTHLHLHPTVFATTLPVAVKHGFQATRLLYTGQNGVLDRIFGGLSARAEAPLRKARIRFTSRTLGLRETGRLEDVTLVRLIEEARHFSIAEIYYHPGVDGPGKNFPVVELTNWRALCAAGTEIDSPGASR